MSRLLNKLLRHLETPISRNDWYKSKARLSVYFSQKGDFGAAAREVLHIRTALQAESSAFGVVCANLAEAVNLFQNGSNIEAMEKARRAYVLSKLISDKSLVAWSSAWRAHFFFSAGHYEEAVASAFESIAEPVFLDVCATARVSLVIADMYHFFDDFQSAKSWYDISRNAAVAEGDEIMTGVILYNIATYRLNSLRMAATNINITSPDTFLLNLEVASSANFDLGVQSSAFPLLLPLLNAQALTLNGRFAEAVKIFEVHLFPCLPEGMKRLSPPLRADYAWCLANLGQHNDSLREISLVNAELIKCEAADDRAMALHRLAMTHKVLGNMEDVRESMSRMCIAIHEHRLIKDQGLATLNSHFINTGIK